MSYSRVVQPRTTRTQAGRGASASGSSYHGGRPPPRPVNRETVDQTSTGDELSSSSGNYAAAGSSAAHGEARSMQSHGSFHVIPPNPQKNANVKRTAEQEESQYERHREVKRQATAEMLAHQPPATVGGARCSKEELDRLREQQEKKQQADARFAKVRQREKREEYHRQQREKEDKEIQKKKEIQREKAERLKVRQQEEQQSRLEETRRARLAKFDKK